jgi:hypothetical protein
MADGGWRTANGCRRERGSGTKEGPVGLVVWDHTGKSTSLVTGCPESGSRRRQRGAATVVETGGACCVCSTGRVIDIFHILLVILSGKSHPTRPSVTDLPHPRRQYDSTTRCPRRWAGIPGPCRRYRPRGDWAPHGARWQPGAGTNRTASHSCDRVRRSGIKWVDDSARMPAMRMSFAGPNNHGNLSAD